MAEVIVYTRVFVDPYDLLDRSELRFDVQENGQYLGSADALDLGKLARKLAQDFSDMQFDQFRTKDAICRVPEGNFTAIHHPIDLAQLREFYFQYRNILHE
jgi:hypothetical protein